MMPIDGLQLAVIAVAIAIQLATVLLAVPLRFTMPKRVWLLFIWLNIAILCRRFMTLFEVHWHWKGNTYETTEALIALSVSVLMLVSIVSLRQHLRRQKQAAEDLAKATVELAHQAKAEDSLAYQLALVFIEQRESNNNGIKEQS